MVGGESDQPAAVPVNQSSDHNSQATNQISPPTTETPEDIEKTQRIIPPRIKLILLQIKVTQTKIIFSHKTLTKLVILVKKKIIQKTGKKLVMKKFWLLI